MREGINIISSDWASGAYILSVAAVETFINEIYLSPVKPYTFREQLPKGLPIDGLEKMELSHKLIILPFLTCGRTFSEDRPPYQDMLILIKIRNDLIHYKMDLKNPKFLKPLQDRKIALNWENLPWVMALETSEGIRWAHNTACLTIRGLIDFLPDNDKAMMKWWIDYFAPISDDEVNQWFTNKQIDPN